MIDAKSRHMRLRVDESIATGEGRAEERALGDGRESLRLLILRA